MSRSPGCPGSVREPKEGGILDPRPARARPARRLPNVGGAHSEGSAMFRAAVFASLLAVGAAADLTAQPFPGPLPPVPGPRTGIEGVWYFRGDPFQPCSVQPQLTP